MDSEIVAEIIDEMIQKCVIGANASEDSIVSSYDEGTSGDEIKLCEQSDTADKYDERTVNYDEEDNGYDFDDETDLIDEFLSLENEDTSEKSLRSDNIRIIDEECVAADNSKACETCDDNNQCQGDGQQEDEVGKVAKAMKTDGVHCDSIRLKGFVTRVYGRFRVVVNLPLMANESKVDEYEIQCEGFPVQMMENELIPLFEKFGQVYKMTKNTASNLITVSYTDTIHARNAIRSLDRSSVQGRTIKVSKRLRNSRLIVRGIPKSATRSELFNKFDKITSGLLSVTIYNDAENEGKNRGFCYLDYGDYEKASAARKILLTKNLFGLHAIVEWPNRRYEWMAVQDTLYIINLCSSLRTEDLSKLFSVYGELLFVKKFGGFGVVHFKNAEDAIRAAQGIDKSQLGNENVDISFVRLSEPQGVPGLSDTLYINNLSPNLSTSDLRKIFGCFGSVMEIEKNGDFAAVRFMNSEQSLRAVRSINKNQLGIDVQISFVKPTEKTPHKNDPQSFETLHIRNLRSGITASDLRKYFTVFGEVKEIDKNDDSASVCFRNSGNAKQAARDIDKRLLGNNVQISFQEMQRNQVPLMSDTLYIKNMYENMTTRRLRQLFLIYGRVIGIDKNGNCAAVQFGNSDQAKRAAQEIQTFHLGRSNVEISLYPKIK